jgi:hypothetical protein
MKSIRQSIRKILKEESESLPNYILRRIQPQNFLNELKRSLIHIYKGTHLDSSISFAAMDVAYNTLSRWDNEDTPEELFNKWSADITTFLTNKYGEQLKEYIKKVYSNVNDEYDKYTYTFVKHVNKNSEVEKKIYYTHHFYDWYSLIRKKGSILPIDWWRVKDELDKIEKGEILFVRPEDEGSGGYYFSIIKELLQDKTPDEGYKKVEIKL